MADEIRIDKYLVENGYFESRNRALDAIKEGKVTINGKSAKPSAKVDSNTQIAIENEKFYVSRAARKLEYFLGEYPFDIEGRDALDIGSSTGGFTQILLENGVKSIGCVDVGSEQLHGSLRNLPQITLYENQDIRTFTSTTPYHLITCDVSFISIVMILKAIDRLSHEGTDIIILYKPQFEVGKEVRRDSNGVVLDLDAIGRKQREFEATTNTLGWKLIAHSPSMLTGKSGNKEYLYHFQKVCVDVS